MTVYRIRRPFYCINEDGFQQIHDPDYKLDKGLWGLERIDGTDGHDLVALNETLEAEGYENEPQLVVDKGKIRLYVHPTTKPETDDEFVVLVYFGDLIYVVYVQDLPALCAVMEYADGLASVSE